MKDISHEMKKKDSSSLLITITIGCSRDAIIIQGIITFYSCERKEYKKVYMSDVKL